MSNWDFDEDDYAPSNQFLDKIIYNVLLDYHPTSPTDDIFLQILVGHSNTLRGDPRGANGWRDLYEEFDKEFRESNPDKKYAFPSAFLTAERVHMIMDRLREQCPYVLQDWKIETNTLVLEDLIELNSIERLILNFAVMIHGFGYEERSLCERLTYGDDKEASRLYARMFALPVGDVAKAMQGFLMSSGFLVPSSSPKGFHQIDPSMSDTFTRPGLTKDTIEQFLFPSNMDTELQASDYDHLSKEMAIAESVVSKGLAQQVRGMNLMLWGIPGTGKTAMALMLAKKNGWNLKIIGDISDGDNGEKSRSQRITSLRIAMKLYARSDNVVLLFDEMEDLFRNQTNDNFSKAFINRIIETTKTPIIWTTNDLMSLGNAILRRMVYNIGFEVPPASARKVMWTNYAAKYDLKLDNAVLEDLAEKYDMVPALIHNAAKITSMSGLTVEQIPEVLASLDRLVNFGEKRKFGGPATMAQTPYDLTLVNADIDMVRMTDRLCKAKPRFAVCAYGPPGTGKSEYFRYLAKRMGKKVLYKRASDMLDMYVGQNERNIADAFRQASEEEKFLIIDEGDTFLRSRDLATRSWEASLTNEMLSQMEAHDQPFALTTNLMKDLDQAALRRFTFKVKFEFLRPEQAIEMFKRYFGVEPPPSIRYNDLLAPGDFANVARKASILEITETHELYEMLVQECDLKPQKQKVIGFERAA